MDYTKCNSGNKINLESLNIEWSYKGFLTFEEVTRIIDSGRPIIVTINTNVKFIS